MEDYGVETAQGLVKAPNGLLRSPTVVCTNEQIT
jgi:hypothetical protein